MKEDLKIFMDHQIFTMQDYGGISRVFVELYWRFNKKEAVECELPMLFSDNVYFEGIKETRGIWRSNSSFIKRLAYYGLNHLFTIFKLLKGDYDVFLPSYYDPYFLPFLRKKPFVLVLHDMTHELYPDTSSAKDKTIAWKKKLVYKADKIIAISENTKKDIIKFYGIEESKIEVIYWATTLKPPQKKVNLDLPKRYIMFVGNRGKYKNFNRFFNACVPLLKDDLELNIVCAGSSAFSEEEKKRFEEEGLGGRVLHVRFKDDEELACIYSSAICLVYPSLYEGFGSPILEAFSCGCPIVLSNRSSLPEIGGDAVVTFDPECEESIYENVKKVILDKEIRERMISKGKDRIKIFTYDKTIDNYLKVFRKLYN